MGSVLVSRTAYSDAGAEMKASRVTEKEWLLQPNGRVFDWQPVATVANCG